MQVAIIATTKEIPATTSLALIGVEARTSCNPLAASVSSSGYLCCSHPLQQLVNRQFGSLCWIRALFKISGLAYIRTARRVHQNVDMEFH